MDVTENLATTYFNVYVNGVYKTRLNGSSISEELTYSEVTVGVEARGAIAEGANVLTFPKELATTVAFPPPPPPLDPPFLAIYIKYNPTLCL